MNTAASSGVKVVVTVTYGQRWKYLSACIESALDQGVGHVIVIDNASTIDIRSLAHDRFGKKVEVVTMTRNRGSAGGYNAGIAHALLINAEFILLLDDDNVLHQGCLEELVAHYDKLANSTDRSLLAVLAFRPDRHEDVALEMPAHGMGGNRRAFFGFDLLDVPFKVFRRTAAGRLWKKRRAIRSQVVVATAPYSGLFFHRSMPEHLGLPNESFLLYADDTEFSHRLTRFGGQIVLVPAARLTDLELSWNVRARYSNTLDALLLGDGDFRAFYSTRNNAFFEDRYCNGGWIRSVNRKIYLWTLWIQARRVHRRERFQLLLEAVRDGESGRLGEDHRFPIA